MEFIPGIIAGSIVLGLLFVPFFGNLEQFVRCIGFVIRPDIINLLTGGWGEEMMAELRFWVWLGLGVGAGVLVTHLLR
ncbi:MAG: hypothetical protein GXO70_06555 [Acidobacteria bacterium]|nr:hypothetical protein [Acidobacteriota bacterium]